MHSGIFFNACELPKTVLKLSLIRHISNDYIFCSGKTAYKYTFYNQYRNKQTVLELHWNVPIRSVLECTCTCIIQQHF